MLLKNNKLITLCEYMRACLFPGFVGKTNFNLKYETLKRLGPHTYTGKKNNVSCVKKCGGNFVSTRSI